MPTLLNCLYGVVLWVILPLALVQLVAQPPMWVRRAPYVVRVLITRRRDLREWFRHGRRTAINPTWTNGVRAFVLQVSIRAMLEHDDARWNYVVRHSRTRARRRR